MSKLIIIGIIAALAVGGAVILLSQGGAPQETETAGSLPELTFTDYEGESVSLQELQGTPLVVNSWAAWCPFCVRELPAFAALQEEFPEITVVAIDRAESLQTAKSYTDDLGVSDDMLFLLDPSDSFYRAIGGFSMPETLFVDKNGVVKEHKRGPMELEEMKDKVQKIL